MHGLAQQKRAKEIERELGSELRDCREERGQTCEGGCPLIKSRRPAARRVAASAVRYFEIASS
jgi:hypothetical protein